MNKLPLVTVITPTFNQADYIEETIESVLAQDYSNIEYIVIDDGSSDTTSVLLDKYSDRCQIIRQENMGQSATLNKGWALSTGEILGYLSSDDRLHRKCISTLVDIFNQDKTASVAYGNFNLINSSGGLMKTSFIENFSKDDMLGKLICYPGPGVLFRREVFDKTGGWNPALRQVPDFEFWLRACDFGSFVRIKDVLADFRIHSESTSFRKLEIEQADEIIGVMAQYWKRRSGSQKGLSLAQSYILSARNHLISCRYSTAFVRIARSFLMRPSVLLSPLNMRLLAAGIFRSTYYRFFRD